MMTGVGAVVMGVGVGFVGDGAIIVSSSVGIGCPKTKTNGVGAGVVEMSTTS